MDKQQNHDRGKKPEWSEVVRRHVESLRFGVVLIVVHDGHVTQIDRTEKVRLE
jgi:hypothetical protein